MQCLLRLIWYNSAMLPGNNYLKNLWRPMNSIHLVSFWGGGGGTCMSHTNQKYLETVDSLMSNICKYILYVLTQCFMLARQVLDHLSHSTSPVCCWAFSRWGLANYLPRLLRTAIFQISASQVARITGVSHQYLEISIILTPLIKKVG
jgi:hypothetical protein